MSKERRKFWRYPYDKPIRYSAINMFKNKNFTKDFTHAASKNLSATGILFVTHIAGAPDISSLLVLDVDYSTASVCREIDERALILDNKLIGRVVRLEDNYDGTCGVGVAFVTRFEPVPKDLRSIEELMSATK